MLKRLFIGLMILTTLASDGIVNIPGNVCDFLTCLNIGAELNKSTETSTGVLNDLKECKGSSNEAFALTLSSFQKICYDFWKADQFSNSVNFGSIQSVNLRERSYAVYCYEEAFSNLEAKTVLDKADTSPPIL